MEPESFGVEEVTEEDRTYRGSRFSEVREAIFANPYQTIWGRPGEAPWPVYDVTLRSVLRGVLPLGGPYLFRKATERAVESHADLRWGPDRRGYRRLLHPNGICLTGVWEITEDNPYSGYFKRDSRALVIGRYSTCCTETRRGHARSLALVGKLYPTMDPFHSERLHTASFITQQDLGGEHTRYINDAELRNAPDTRAWRRGAGVPILLVTGAVFQSVDRQPSQRQLYEIAELGKGQSEATRAPEFMRLLLASDQPRIDGDALDFRDEIMAQIYDRADAAPKRSLTFYIEVTDEGTTHGLPVYQWRSFKNWRRVGRMVFRDAVASYNGDFVIHFHHPTWRRDRNDPSTSVRMGGQQGR